jgi:hypothetical protein
MKVAGAHLKIFMATLKIPSGHPHKTYEASSNKTSHPHEMDFLEKEKISYQIFESLPS